MKSSDIFKDPESNKKFLAEGYVTAPLLNQEEIEILKNAFHKMNPDEGSGFYASLFDSSYDKKKQSDLIIREVIGEKVMNLLSGFRPVIANYVIKYPGKESIMYPHQDWCFVDEDLFYSLNIWIPLTTTDFNHGSLHLLKKSHQLPKTYRGVNIPSAVSEIAEKIDLHSMHEVKINPGNIVFYDHRMIHASPPNYGTDVRIAAAMVVIPQQADLLHYAKVNDRLCCYKIENDFFYKFTYANNAEDIFPKEYVMVDSTPFNKTTYTIDQIMPKNNIFTRLFKKKN